MEALNKLLDTARKMRSHATDAALAEALGVKRSAVSNWRNGRAYPDEISCARLADMTEQPLGRVLGVIGEARAVSKDAKAVWRRLAAAAALAVMVLGAAPLPRVAQATDSAGNSGAMYIMSTLRRMLRGFRTRNSGLFDQGSSFAYLPA